ncbi:MAG: CapA family protein [Clostridiales bacterium]|nr:CapA family protein [Clostridiales bacterium]
MPRDLETIKKDIGSLRGQVDIIAVSLHWGVEESFEIPASQTEFAHLLLDAGADMILGHHPHQFQGMEIYKGKPILYSMGNFLFDQNDPENMESFIIQMEYSDKKLKSLTATPVRILEKCHVEVQSGDEAKSLLEREKSLSEKLGTSFSIIDDRLVYESMD